ncbi:MAG: hypothetical protein EOL93_09550 [Epsilonproteobacteria bacterium]|nr:hypothetical protein [Campylobacterota bacterium]
MEMEYVIDDICFVGIGAWSPFSNEPQLSVFATKTINGETQYFYPKNTPDKSLGGLSVEEYKQSKKCGLLEIAKPSQILRAMAFFHKELNKIKGF